MVKGKSIGIFESWLENFTTIAAAQEKKRRTPFVSLMLSVLYYYV